MTTNYETMSFDTLSKIKVSEKPKENKVFFVFPNRSLSSPRSGKVVQTERNAK